jgi:hypothetical protein
MYSVLPDILLADGVKERLLADSKALIESELSAKSGVSAAAVKVAYKAVTGIAPGYYQSVLEHLTPRLLEKLQPYWTDFHAAGGGQFGDYLVKRGDEVSESLLSVTDEMTQRSHRTTVVKAYNAVRGGAHKHVEAALPAVGALIEKYAG